MIEQMDRIKFSDPEINQEPQFDAILVHGYWMSEPEPGDVRLALRSRLAVRAAAIAHDEGWGAKHIVLPLGQMWGAKYESTGNLMADELENKYRVPQQAIIREGNAYSTGGEVETFLKIAQKNGWTRLLDIAFSEHFLTIPGAFKAYSSDPKTSVQFKSVEEIIEQYDEAPINRLVKRLGNSGYGLTYKFYERIKWALTHSHLPWFSYYALEKRNRRARTKKGRESFIPIDVYKL